MTAQILYKELRLVLHPAALLFVLFGAMLLIPSYPYYVAIFYGTLGVFFCFMNARENRDVYYSAVLPASKRAMVRGRVLFVAVLELAQLALAVPFAIVSVRINPNGGNPVGIDPNVAFFGLSLLLFGIFNVVFLLRFYRTGVNVGRSYLVSMIPVTLYIVAAEVLVHVPGLGAYLDGTDAAAQLAQLPVLAGGAILYALLTWVSFCKAAARFERVDL